MSHDRPVTLSSLLSLGLNTSALHNVGAGILLGSNLYSSFIAGPLMFSAVPRTTFGNIQARILPTYFGLQSSLTALLLVSWFTQRRFLTNDVFASLGRPRQSQSFNAWLLITLLATNVANLALVGPWTTSVMKHRHKLERAIADNKNTTESGELKRLQKQFSILHALSALLNLTALGANIIHVAWIGAYGF